MKCICFEKVSVSFDFFTKYVIKMMMSVFPLSIFPNNITTVSCNDNRTYRLIQKHEPKDTERFLRHLTENIESG